jgi:hypothetical protein
LKGLVNRRRMAAEEAGMTLSALIEFVCAAHVQPDDTGPKVTLLNGAWALCAGHGDDGHDWTAIAPTRREFIGDSSQVQRLQAS